MSEKCGVARLIDIHKRQACLSILRELLKPWPHPSAHMIGSSACKIFAHMYHNVGDNQTTLSTTMEIIFQPTNCMLTTDVERPQRIGSKFNKKVSDAIQRFEEFLDCGCTWVLDSSEEKSSQSKLVLNIRGISATSFEKGASEHGTQSSH